MPRDDHDTTTGMLRDARGDAQSARMLLVLGAGDPSVVILPDVPAATIGRGRSADVHIDDPSLSRVHARLTFGLHVTLEDLGSSNGTRVGGVTLIPGRAVVVAPGTSLQLGAVLAVLHASPAPAPTLVGTSDGSIAGAQALEGIVARLAHSELPVWIVGDAGVGKSALARRLHDRSARASGPFVVVNAASDAREASSSAGGTLVIDEIADVLPSLQRGLLAQIDKGHPPPRLIATSRRDVAAELQRGTISRDLHDRVHGVTIVVPPLRSRLHEIAPLAAAIAPDAAHSIGRAPPVFAPDALAVLERHVWPGNVRELETCVRRVVAVAPGRVLTASHFAHLADPATRASSPRGGGGGVLREARDHAEYQRIIEALRACRGNQTRAAEMLGISRGTLLTRLEKFGVPRPRKAKA